MTHDPAREPRGITPALVDELLAYAHRQFGSSPAHEHKYSDSTIIAVCNALIDARRELADLRARHEQAMAALRRTAFIYHVNVEYGNYYLCRLCEGETDGMRPPRSPDSVKHADDCIFAPAPPPAVTP